MSQRFETMSTLLQKGKMNDLVAEVQAALSEGIGPKDILEQGLITGMGIIGGKFKRNEVFVPEVLIAARAMNKALSILEPELLKAKVESKGRVVIGTVKGDLHDIGKNLVAIMFKGAGFQVIDIGVDCSAEKFVEAAKTNNAQVIAVSALLTTTMVNMKEVIDGVKTAGIGAKVIVGGAPVTENYANEIGADGYSADAASAVDLLVKLVA